MRTTRRRPPTPAHRVGACPAARDTLGPRPGNATPIGPSREPPLRRAGTDHSRRVPTVLTRGAEKPGEQGTLPPRRRRRRCARTNGILLGVVFFRPRARNRVPHYRYYYTIVIVAVIIVVAIIVVVVVFYPDEFRVLLTDASVYHPTMYYRTSPSTVFFLQFFNRDRRQYAVTAVRGGFKRAAKGEVRPYPSLEDLEIRLGMIGS